MGVTQMDMTSPRWSVSTITRWDTLQGNAEDPGTKIVGTGIKTALEGLYMWKKLLLKPCWLLMELVFTGAIWQMMKSPQTWLLWLFQTLRLFSPPNLDLSNSGLEEFQQPNFEGYGPKTSKNVSEDTSNKVRESLDAPMVEKLVSDDKLEKKSVIPTVAKIEFANCNYHQRERVVSENNYTRVNYNYSAKKAHPSAHRNMAPRVVLMKTGLRPLNTARPVNTAHPKTTVYSARPMSHFYKSAQSTGHPQKEDQGYVDSGCSRHMTRNMSYLSDFKEFDEGYVTFGGGAK
ncbi:hypothetical protein Tco_0850425 [Tanacetum coccineum]